MDLGVKRDVGWHGYGTAPTLCNTTETATRSPGNWYDAFVLKCGSCGAQAAVGDKFCQQCGVRIYDAFVLKCVSCGAQAAVGDKFCQQCGVRITAGPHNLAAITHAPGRQAASRAIEASATRLRRKQSASPSRNPETVRLVAWLVLYLLSVLLFAGCFRVLRRGPSANNSADLQYFANAFTIPVDTIASTHGLIRGMLLLIEDKKEHSVSNLQALLPGCNEFCPSWNSGCCELVIGCHWAHARDIRQRFSQP